MFSRRPFVVQTARDARCSPGRVMEQILDSGRWPSWQPEISETRGSNKLVGGDVVTGDASMLGFDVSGHATVEDVSISLFDEDVIVGVRMRIRYEVTVRGDGCTVTAKLTAYLPRGAAGRVLSLFLKRRLRWMQRTAIENLVRQAEAGPSL